MIILRIISIIIILFVFFAATITQAATLSLSPVSGNYNVGESFNVSIILDTKGHDVSGVDIRYLNYDPSLIQVQDADSQKSGVQITPGSLFPITIANLVKESEGKIEFSQLTSGSTTYKGFGVLATISFKVLSAGTSSLVFDFRLGNTLDTNVALNGQDILSSVVNGSYSFGNVSQEGSSGGGSSSRGGGGGSYSGGGTITGGSRLSTTTQASSWQPISSQKRIEEIKKEIARLIAELNRLQNILSQIQKAEKKSEIKGIPLGYKFNKNLWLGKRGEDVKYLQIFLKNQGKQIYPEGIVNGYFNYATKRAVIKFQEKYGSEILAPLKLKKGTGYVGFSTRKKINQMLP